MEAESAEMPKLNHPDTLAIDGRSDIHLRMISRDDVPELYQIMTNNREHLERHVQTGDLTVGGIEKSVDWMLENIRNGSYLQYRIIADKKIIGSAVLYDIDTAEGVAKAGIWVEKSSEGRGYASLAMKRLIDYGFDEMELKKVIFDIDPDNEKSEQLAQRLGARLTGNEVLTERFENSRDFTYRRWEVTR